jgi:hypothetical protein
MLWPLSDVLTYPSQEHRTSRFAPFDSPMVDKKGFTSSRMELLFPRLHSAA